ncbi:MAG: hypothetical protein ABR968_11910, partial [Bacteroidales bacterium]
MKKTLLIIIFLMTGIYLFAQTKNDLLELKLNGKVKSLKEIEIDTVFGVGKVGDTIKKRIIFFNEKGNKNEMDEYWYRSTTDLSNGTLNRKDITKYND